MCVCLQRNWGEEGDKWTQFFQGFYRKEGRDTEPKAPAHLPADENGEREERGCVGISRIKPWSGGGPFRAQMEGGPLRGGTHFSCSPAGVSESGPRQMGAKS